MLKICFLFSIIFSSFSFGQYILRGNVNDADSLGVQGVRVSISNSTYGVNTNYNGDYFIELKQKGDYLISFSKSGYKTEVINIKINSNKTILNTFLTHKIQEIGEVEIVTEKIDVAKKIMKATIKNKRNFRNQIDHYTCNSYVKTSLQKDLKPKIRAKIEVKDSIRKAKVRSDSTIFLEIENNITPKGPEKMNFIESYSKTYFELPGRYHEQVLAHHDYADKYKSESSASVQFDFKDGIVPQQAIQSNPYIFYEKVEDGDFNLYQNLIDLPKISSKPLISPLSDVSGFSYKYDLRRVFEEEGQKIYDIEITPRNSMSSCFSGHLYIIDSIWVVKSFDLKINPSTMEFFKAFRLTQDVEKIAGKWAVVRREFDYTIVDLRWIISANTRVKHTNYDFETQIPKGKIGNELLSYDDGAYDKDSTFWAEFRPLKLKQEELLFIKEQDSITSYLESEAYLDSIDKAYNKVTFWDVTLNGIGFKNRYKKRQFFINSILGSANIFGVGGFRYGFGGGYIKEYKNAHKLDLSGEIDYGFKNKDVKGEISAEYTFLPLKFGSFKFHIGDTYEMINNYESVLGTFSRSNYVRKKALGFSQRLELKNGLFARVGFEYSDRQAITNLQLADWSNQIFGTLNEPKAFDRYTLSMFTLEMVYRVKQKYIIKGGKKQIVGSKFPELKLTYKKGVPRLFNSEVNFDYLEISANDEVKLGTFGDFKWNAAVGSFLNKVDLRFIEHKFFRGSDSFLFSNPLTSNQLLDSTFNTSSPYLQAFAIHHFNGALMNKIPLIKYLNLEVSAGASALLIQDINYSHIEFFSGIEKRFKIRQQLFRVGVYAATRVNSLSSGVLRWKIGIDFFNSYTNKWTY